MRITGNKKNSFFHYKRGYIAMADGMIVNHDPNNMIFEARLDSLRWKQHPHHDIEIDPKIADEIVQIVTKQQEEREQKDASGRYQSGIKIVFV